MILHGTAAISDFFTYDDNDLMTASAEALDFSKKSVALWKNKLVSLLHS